MACDISKGRAINCKDQIGGLKKAWLVDFNDLGTVTLGSNDEATDASGTDGSQEGPKAMEVTAPETERRKRESEGTADGDEHPGTRHKRTKMEGVKRGVPPCFTLHKEDGDGNCCFRSL